MNLHEILRVKGTEVYTVGPNATLARAVEQLVHYNCGSLVVVDDADSTRMVGIITERDILKACASGKVPLEAHRVCDVMTKKVRTGTPTDTVADTMGLLTERRIRHLPIVEDERLAGMISIGDVVKAQHHELSAENHFLKDYIQS